MVLTPSAGDLSIDKLAQLADRILEASPPSISATVVQQPQQSDPTTTQLADAVNRKAGQTNQPDGTDH